MRPVSLLCVAQVASSRVCCGKLLAPADRLGGVLFSADRQRRCKPHINQEEQIRHVCSLRRLAQDWSTLVDVHLTIVVLQLSYESGLVSVISSFCSTFFAVTVVLGKLRHTLARCPGLPHDKHLILLPFDNSGLQKKTLNSFVQILNSTGVASL